MLHIKRAIKVYCSSQVRPALSDGPLLVNGRGCWNASWSCTRGSLPGKQYSVTRVSNRPTEDAIIFKVFTKRGYADSGIGAT